MTDPPLASVEVAHRGSSTVIVRVAGEIDGSNIAEIEGRVAQAAAHFGRLVLDLSLLQYMDSQALRWLVQSADDSPPALTVVAPPTSFAGRVLTLSGLTELLGVVASSPEDEPASDARD